MERHSELYHRGFELSVEKEGFSWLVLDGHIPVLCVAH